MANYLLNNLELSELSLVDRPANPGAMVSLFKRDNGETMDNEVIKKITEMVKGGMSEEDAAKEIMDQLAKAEDVDRLRGEVSRLTKALIENGFKITAEAVEKKAEEETIDIDGETVLKSDIPAAVLKKLEEAEVAKAEADIKKRIDETVPNLDENVARTLIKMADTEGEDFLNFLKAADKLFEAQMEEVGKTAAKSDFENAEDALEALVKQYMEDNKLAKSDYAKAYSAVVKTDEGKALVNKVYKGD